MRPVDSRYSLLAVAQSISTFNFQCVMCAVGEMKCVGRNQYGQLGIGSTEDIGDEPSEMGDALVGVALGADFTISWIGALGSATCGMVCSLH